MAKDGSVAPKERVNITYKSATGDAQEETELPLKVLAIGDYTGRPDERPLEERKPININKDNFTEVLKEHQLKVEMAVPDKLSGEDGAEMSVSLELKSLKDFEPEGVVEQVPELKRLLELREALTALKGPLSSRRGFRKKLEELLSDESGRDQLMKELGLGGEE
ncbi:MAG: type VI secretion system contractile sheath small subunit [Myxococcales bacterium]|jgi:type VI secretion system protein ImpB